MRIEKKVKFWQSQSGTDITYISNGGEIEGIQIKEKGERQKVCKPPAKD